MSSDFRETSPQSQIPSEIVELSGSASWHSFHIAVELLARASSGFFYTELGQSCAYECQNRCTHLTQAWLFQRVMAGVVEQARGDLDVAQAFQDRLAEGQWRPTIRGRLGQQDGADLEGFRLNDWHVAHIGAQET